MRKLKQSLAFSSSEEMELTIWGGGHRHWNSGPTGTQKRGKLHIPTQDISWFFLVFRCLLSSTSVQNGWVVGEVLKTYRRNPHSSYRSGNSSCFLYRSGKMSYLTQQQVELSAVHCLHNMEKRSLIQKVNSDPI